MKIGKIHYRTVAVLAVVITSLMASSVWAKPKGKTLKVGIALRLDDKFNDTVYAMMTGIETAKALYEKRHPGVTVVLKRYPHGDDLASVVSAAAKANEDHTAAVVGGELSEESLVLGEKLGEKHVVFITPTSSNPNVTEGRPYAFRACFSDRLVASKLAEFTARRLKPTVVGVLHNVSSPYTDFLSKQFIQTFDEIMASLPANKRVPLIEEKVLKDTQDFDQQIQNFIDKKVTHVAMLLHQSDLLKFALQAANKGFFPVYIGSDGWGSNEHVFKNLVSESPFGARFHAFRNSYWKEDSRSKMAVDFKAAYEEQHKRKPTAWSAISFDATWTLLVAMDRAKDPNSGESIRAALTNIKDLQLVTADHFKFGSDNSPRKDLFIYRLDKSGVNYEATLR